MKILVAEDDFASRKYLNKVLATYGECDIAVDGKEAIDAFENSIKEGARYDVIFLDIMMPQFTGQEVLEKIRAIEEQAGVLGLEGTKIIMTTALDSSQSILGAFKSGCEGYLVKPIDKDVLIAKMKELGLPV